MEDTKPDKIVTSDDIGRTWSNDSTLHVASAKSQDPPSNTKQEVFVPAAEASPPRSLEQPSTSIAESLKGRLLQFSLARRILAVMGRDGSGFEDTRNKQSNDSITGRAWHTSFIRFGPLSGIFCMLLAIGSLIASLGILAGSDGQAVAGWSVPPSTYLAIFTALANLSVRYAAINGVVIAWWFRAMRGSTLAKLHWDWKSGTTLRGALTAGRNMGLLGLACIFSTIVVIDGPLLQRASTVVLASMAASPVSLNISMAPQIPRDYTGMWLTAGSVGGDYPQAAMFNDTVPAPHHRISNYIYASGNPDFTPSIVVPWLNRSALHIVEGCQRKCKAKIRAPALFATDCVKHSQPGGWDLSFNTTIIEHLRAPPLENNAFTASVLIDTTGEQEALNLFAGYSNVINCRGTYTYKICSLRSGIGEYDISIDANTATLDAPVSPKFISLAQNAPVNHTYIPKYGGQPSTLALIAQQGFFFWQTAMFYYKSGPTILSLNYGLGAYQPFQLPAEGPCNAWRDPTSDILEDLNSLMVYVGAQAATMSSSQLASLMDPGLEARTTVTGYFDGEHNVFHTDYWFFLGAAIVEVACIVLVIPTYWGWWKIGRPVSFSPLEMAKAFESPMLADCNSNSSGRDLAKALGDIQVKYGVVQAENGMQQTKITFDDPLTVGKPQDGMRFDV